ncbi:ribosome recycling factor [bacterium (Candidatus Moisslbacteria) CG12_big_fil_rev_8_21_14_0_65_36_11]|nr:ribosome recycling factor [Candidatus Kuenenbacteria bacterium]PIW68066.1 MAG: ribosome recycling factor [bacterium (Candidatus Moisslbacteria) CG12_big_fil_rev_8_21_14_0_65_36_11]
MVSNELIKKAQEEFIKVINFLINDLKSLRTNRVTTDYLKHLRVESYGVMTPIEQLASLSILEPRTIVIEPWDKNILKEIERTIAQADLGISFSIRENKIFAPFPPLTEETRNQLLKILKTKLENARKSLRMIRDKIKMEIVAEEKIKKISEDEKYRLLEELNKLTLEKEAEILGIGQRKEREIMAV